MAKLVTLHDADGEVIYPQSVWDENMIPDNTVKSSMIDWSTMPGSYSTTEQKTPFTWIDGKPIYKKTIDFGSLPNNSTKNVAHGISNLGDLIDIRGTTKTSWGTYQLPLVFPGSDVNYITNVSVNATNISMSNSADRSGFTAYVTLWYTKTTD